MLKRNSIAIAIAFISLTLILTGNAFGQRKNQRTRAKQPVTSGATQKAKIKRNAPIITETTIPVKAPTTTPQSNARRRPRWEMPDFDADINTVKTNQPANSTGSRSSSGNYIGETEKNLNKQQPTTKTKVKPMVGGSGDGQSNRRKQRRNRRQ